MGSPIHGDGKGGHLQPLRDGSSNNLRQALVGSGAGNVHTVAQRPVAVTMSIGVIYNGMRIVMLLELRILNTRHFSTHLTFALIEAFVAFLAEDPSTPMIISVYDEHGSETRVSIRQPSRCVGWGGPALDNAYSHQEQ